NRALVADQPPMSTPVPSSRSTKTSGWIDRRTVIPPSFDRCGTATARQRAPPPEQDASRSRDGAVRAECRELRVVDVEQLAQDRVGVRAETRRTGRRVERLAHEARERGLLADRSDHRVVDSDEVAARGDVRV